MPRPIAILTPYLPCDTTYAALRMADVLRDHGKRVQVVFTNQRPRPTMPFWDGRLGRYEREWQELRKHVQIWFMPPDEQQAERLLIDKTPYILIDNAHGIRQYHPGPELVAAAVIKPNSGPVLNLYSNEASTVVALPWDIGGKWQRTRNKTDVPTVLLPMHHMYWKMFWYEYVRTALDATLGVGGRVILTRSPFWPRQLEEYVDQVRAEQDPQHPRLHIKSVKDSLCERLLFGSCDLVFWPAFVDPFGTITQLALYAGTPVLTWYELGGAELISLGRNGHLVEIPPDPHMARHNMYEVLSRIVGSARLSQMRERTGAPLHERQQLFVKQAISIVEDLRI